MNGQPEDVIDPSCLPACGARGPTRGSSSATTCDTARAQLPGDRAGKPDTDRDHCWDASVHMHAVRCERVIRCPNRPARIDPRWGSVIQHSTATSAENQASHFLTTFRLARTVATCGTVPVIELGYARVSTVKHDLDRQIDALEQTGIPRDRIYVDKKSGATTDPRAARHHGIRARGRRDRRAHARPARPHGPRHAESAPRAR